MAMLAAPGPRVPMHRAGRLVSCPTASAMKAAELSLRAATTLMWLAASPSRRLSTLSPGTVKAILTPARAKPSARTAPTVVAVLWLSVIDIDVLLEDAAPEHRAVLTGSS